MELHSIFFYFCKMIKRNADTKLTHLARTFKAVAVTGPRQSGKTTLIKTLFKDKPYISLENIDNRNYALQDPRGFLSNYPKGVILDEIQRTPELFSYLQERLDNSKAKGQYILSGSNNFLIQQNITQSLAGRIGYLNLLPFSSTELAQSRKLLKDDNALLLQGFFPPVYDQKIPAPEWCQNYIRTYIERDVRQIKNISDLLLFQRFMALLAGRCGQELNASTLSNEAGVDVKTIQSWIGILESSFIVFLLKPHHKNFNKIIVKRPKVYFYDTALVCSLLQISNTTQLNTHPLRGAIFENMIILEFIKERTNKGLPINLFYWRDKTGHEIDLLIDNAGKLSPIEIKSGKTINNEFFKNLTYWDKISNQKNGLVIYAGDENQKRSNGIEIKSWRSIF